MIACDVAQLPIMIHQEKVAAFCQAKGIRKLSLFGSVLRQDFDSQRSDVDVLAEFKPGALRGIGWTYFGYGEELGEILGHRVDFCGKLNSHIRPKIENELMPIYELP
ncbi:MAG: nucleotidyltransferase domain-containing protein [Verrucomicrobia bacterium]|nr:nucleotidyltransferase domain-containing protein [Verrucomicrobiota bacterium]